MLTELLKRLPPMPAIDGLARQKPGTLYLVGGLLRDLELRRDASTLLDIDVTTAGSARACAMELGRRLHGAWFPLDKERGVWRVAVKGPVPCQVDVAALQGKDILEDLSRRDFTVNSLALPLPLGSGDLLDPHGGLGDLRKRVLRALSLENLKDDPLRTLRAYRLAARLGLTLAPQTSRWVRQAAPLITRCAAERIRTELVSLLGAPDAGRWLESLDEAGLLTAILPELEPSRRCAKVYYGEGGVLRHTLKVVSRLDFLFAQLRSVYPALAKGILEDLSSHCGGLERHQALLRMAALLHDVSKPECARHRGGRLRFFGHESRGAERTEMILGRLRYSRDEIRWASKLVLHHLRPGNLAASRIVTDKAVFRFFRDLGESGVSCLLLCWADHASYLPGRTLGRLLPLVREDPHTFDPAGIRPADTRKTLYYLQTISYLLARRFQEDKPVLPERLLDGNEVMRARGMKPGPGVGEILRRLQEAQAEGRVKDKRQALMFIKTLDI
ncbi:MAG: HD domain-containing protein [Elusimicrobiota bacterium]